MTRPEPIAHAPRKQKVVAAVQAPVPNKATEKRKCMKGSSRSGHQTSAQELALAKPLKQSRKFSSQSSGLSIIEKLPPRMLKLAGGKTSSTSAGGGGAGRDLSCALDLFDSGSSASNGEVLTPVPHRKHPQKSPPSKAILKPSNTPTAKGTSVQSFTFHLS
jgi:hypothetical protein